ncbi:hypothetical protein EGK65_02330 [Citrobacter farmeri]|nr:hypothetical protein EGK65_02330 [Citrobacter farmeri]
MKWQRAYGLNVRFWHIAAFMTVTLRHGVLGVGGSNPLVPTKIPLKNQPFTAGFFMPEICTG